MVHHAIGVIGFLLFSFLVSCSLSTYLSIIRCQSNAGVVCSIAVKRTIWIHLFLLILWSYFPSVSRAQSDQSLDTSQDRATSEENRVALIVSGGVSLGAYQAGMLYYLSEYWKKVADKRPDGKMPVSILTGASAGALNAIATAIEACSKPQSKPENSLFFTWTQLTMEKLYPSDREAKPDSIFTREKANKAVFNKVLDRLRSSNQWHSKPCEIDLGLVVNRMRARYVEVEVQNPTHAQLPLQAPRMTEKFVLKLRSEPDVKEALIEQIPKALQKDRLLLMMGDDPNNVAVEDIRDLLYASSAFPIAFPPVKLKYRDAYNKVSEAVFFDGGTFENIPVKLATRIQKAREEHSDVDYVVINPFFTRWSHQANNSSQSSDEYYKNLQTNGLLSLILPIGLDLVASARSAELLSAFEESIKPYIPVRDSFLASTYISDFFGFFDGDLLAFDFYMGMIDARAFLDNTWRHNHVSTHISLDKVDRGIDSQSYHCLRYLQKNDVPGKDVKYKELLRRCHSELSTNTSSVAQSIKIYAATRTMRDYALGKKKKAKDTSDLGLFLQELERSDFVFDELYGLRLRPSTQFLPWLRRQSGRVYYSFIASQNDIQVPKPVYEALGDFVLNHSLEYIEPEHYLSAGLHLNRGADVDYAYTFKDHHRVGMGLRLRGVSLIKKEVSIRIFPVAKYEYIQPFNPNFGFEIGIEAGAGYLNEEEDKNRFLFALGSSVTLTALQRLYLKLDAHAGSVSNERKTVQSMNNWELLSLSVGFGLRFPFYNW